ncbi:MAG: hypothetical protein K0S53_589 [Bacteroidetes bacterium]|nr:hypothetical protein [Bacteroidota bacterium]MDF2451354.1 hypothetical protein [Bacteroidota bacterium]
MSKILKKLGSENIFFAVLFLSILFFLNFHSIFFLNPRSFHFIRQTDTLSFVSYYLKNDLNFFNVGNLNLYNESGKTLCEFPILYYLTALISKLGAKSYLVLKTIHLIFFFLTSYTIFNYLRNKFSFINAVSITYLLFSSTVILYYSVNHIPNYPALCLSLCGIVYFLKYLESNTRIFFNISMVLFLFACLIKITFAVYPIGFLIFLIIKWMKNRKYEKYAIAVFFLLFSVLLVWNLYVLHYNKINNADYYLTHIKPIWSMSSTEVKEVFLFIINYWVYKYYYHSAIHTFFIVLIISMFFYKNFKKDQLLLSFIFLSGTFFYFILFFKQFRDHDYYFMEFVPLFFLIFVNSYEAIIFHLNTKIKIAISLFIMLITVLSINYAKLNLNRRYSSPFEQVSRIAYVLENSDAKLDSLGIPENAKILVVPDFTMNGSLFLLDRFGYTVGDTLNSNMASYFSKSDYILISDSSYLNNMKNKFKLTSPILKYRTTELFKISH